jgi:hypothetical protein
VTGELLFYKHNRFEFSSSKSMAVYLPALTAEKRNAIRYISVPWDRRIMQAPAFTLAAACQNLRVLTIGITLAMEYFNPPIREIEEARGYRQLLRLRGLKELKLTYDVEGEYGQGWDFVDMVWSSVRKLLVSPSIGDYLRIEIAEFEEEINRVVCSQTKADSKFSEKCITKALYSAGLTRRDSPGVGNGGSGGDFGVQNGVSAVNSTASTILSVGNLTNDASDPGLWVSDQGTDWDFGEVPDDWAATLSKDRQNLAVWDT